MNSIKLYNHGVKFFYKKKYFVAKLFFNWVIWKLSGSESDKMRVLTLHNNTIQFLKLIDKEKKR